MNCTCCNLTRNPPPPIPTMISSSSSSFRARVRVSRRSPSSLCFNRSSSSSHQNFTSPSSSSITTYQVRPFSSSSSSSSSSSVRFFLLRNYNSSSSSRSSPSCGGFHRCSKATRVCPTTYFPTTLSSSSSILENNKIGVLQYKNNYYSYMGVPRVRFFSAGSTLTNWEEKKKKKNGGRSEKDSTTLPWIAATSYEERQGRKAGRQKKKNNNNNKDNKDMTTTQSETNHSSWEISAQRYFSRNDTNSPKMATEESRNNKSLVVNERNTSYGKADRKGEEPPHSRPFPWEVSRNGSSKLSKENRANRDAGHGFRRRNTVGAKEEDRGEEEEVEVEMKDAEPVNEPRWDRIKSNYRGFVDTESRRSEVRHWNMQENWGKKTWKEGTESSLPKMAGQGVYGLGPVLAALTVERREFYALYIQQGLELGGNNNNNNKKKKKDRKGVEKVFELAEKMGLKVIEASKHDLNMLVDNRPHQGLVLDASPLELVNIKELEPPSSPEGQKAPLWVALDEVTDPQNLGAIVRSSYFFGAEGVVLCAKNSAPLSGVVSKASAGSLELIELRSCKNMMQFLSSSTENGWRVLGGSVASRALPLSTVEAGVPTILVLGSEGTGLRPLVERSCTQLIRIPGNTTIGACPGENEIEPEVVEQTHSGPELKSFLAVESLNVSVAAGVLLYHLVGSNSHLPDNKPDIAYA